MTLKACKECGNDVSNKAESCPHCGVKLTRPTLGCGGGCAILILLIVILFAWSSAQTSSRKLDPPSRERTERKEWEVIGRPSRYTTTVYMPPEKFSDKDYIAKILGELRSRRSVQHIHFFDKKSKTPTRFPMTDEQMLHLRAQYSVNKNTGHELFQFLTVTDETTSPPEYSGREANIRPGH